MSALRKATCSVLALGLMGALLAALTLTPPTGPVPLAGSPHPARKADPTALEVAPPQVRAFLDRALTQLPTRGEPASLFQFYHWEQLGKPTQEALGVKAVPGLDPDAFIARVMQVNDYPGNIPHVTNSRSLTVEATDPTNQVQFHQQLSVPGIARVQHIVALVDAGTIKGYRVAYWYLLESETAALDRNQGARSEQNVGAWFAAPGVAAYAFSSWPRRSDVNLIQWATLTSGADTLAQQVIETNIDSMAAWASKR